MAAASARPPGLTTEEFTAFAAAVDTPMYVVTAYAGEERSGCLVGFVTQTSVDPPRMLVCLSKNNRTYEVARHTDVLALHALGEDQMELATLFGGQTGDETDKFTRCAWEEGPGGVPLVRGCRALTVGVVQERHDLGDHVGHLLEPFSVWVQDDRSRKVLGLWQAEEIDPGHCA